MACRAAGPGRGHREVERSPDAHGPRTVVGLLREWSYIIVSSEDTTQHAATATVTRGYALQRYMLACAGRGAYPIKFNGSLFTVDTYDRPGPAGGLDADFRRWGGPYWFQKTHASPTGRCSRRATSI